jgi:O-antigen/teichoic acid export membrane protein
MTASAGTSAPPPKTLATARAAGGQLLARNTLLNVAGQVVPLLVAVAAVPVLLRHLGSGGYGLLSIALAALGFFGILDLGLGRATVHAVADHLTPEGAAELPGIVWTSVFALLAVGTAMGAAGAAIVPVVLPWLRMPPALVIPARNALWLLCAGLPVLLAGDGLRGVLQALHRFDLVNYIRGPAASLLFAVAAVAAWRGVGVEGVVLLLVLLRAAAAAGYLVAVLVVLPAVRAQVHPAHHVLRRLFSFGGWVMAANVTGALFTYIDRFFIAAVLSVGTLTYYAVPIDFVGRGSVLPASLGSALFPFFSQHSGDPAGRVRAATLRGVRFTVFCMAPLTAFLLACGGEILRLWLGAAFAAASTQVVRVLAVAFLFNAFAYIPYAAIQALDHPAWKAWLDMALLPVYAAAVWVLLQRTGLVGAAWAKLLSSALDCGLLFLLAGRLRAVAWRDYCSASFLRVAGLGVGVLVASVALRAFGCRGVGLLGAECGVIGVYAILFWCYAADAEEAAIAGRLWARIRRGPSR